MAASMAMAWRHGSILCVKSANIEEISMARQAVVRRRHHQLKMRSIWRKIIGDISVNK